MNLFYLDHTQANLLAPKTCGVNTYPIRLSAQKSQYLSVTWLSYRKFPFLISYLPNLQWLFKA